MYRSYDGIAIYNMAGTLLTTKNSLKDASKFQFRAIYGKRVVSKVNKIS